LSKKTSQKPSHSSPERPGFFRYIAAIFYDAVLIIALFFLATALLLPFNDGEAIQAPILFPLYLLSISFFFLAWFWTHGGQTLGMQAWNLHLVSETNSTITWYQALTRFLTAIIAWLPLGLGIFWRLWQKEGKTWQDLNSKSTIQHKPFSKNTKKVAS
jgi:uncharacterized RDD family membrane protein YckC